MKKILTGGLLVLLMAGASALMLSQRDRASAAGHDTNVPASNPADAAIKLAPTPKSATGLANKLSLANAALAEQAAKHVVMVVVDRRRAKPSSGGGGLADLIPGLRGNNDPLFKDLSIGPYSGVIVGANGEILISDGILGAFNDSGADRAVRNIYVILNDGRTYSASVVGRDGGADLALLKIQETGLDALPLDSEVLISGEGKLRGRSLTVVNRSFNPLRYGSTDGVCSAEFREGGRAFQLDARLGGCDMGGLIVDKASQKVVGIATMLRVDDVGQASGVSYGAHIANVKKSLVNLRNGEFSPKPPQPFLGVELEATESGIGMKLTRIIPGSSADKAGLKVGDILIKANMVEVNTMIDLRRVLALLEVGDQLKMEVNRDGDLLNITATLGARDIDVARPEPRRQPEREPEPAPPRENTGPKVRMGITLAVGSTEISEVTPGGNAANAGLMVGDVLKSLDNKIVNSVEDVLEALMDYEVGDSVSVVVDRGGDEMTISLTFK